MKVTPTIEGGVVHDKAVLDAASIAICEVCAVVQLERVR